MPDDRDARIAQLEAEVASLRAENAGLHQREAGTTEILQAIASSTSDLQRVLDLICSNALHLTGGDKVAIDLL
jgi:hypothetical protein